MNQTIHILFLCSWFPSRVKPTSGDFVQRHAESVASKNEVTVIHVIADKNLKAGIQLVLSKKNNVNIIIGYIRKSNNPLLKFYLFIKAYRKCLKKVAFFDLVHLHVAYPKGIVALYLKWFKRKRFIISEHWTGYQSNRNISIGFIRKFLTKLIIRHSSIICPVSKNLQSEMIAIGLKGNYCIVPNVVDTSVFNISNRTRSTFNIIHISHMGNNHKNVRGIIKCVGKLQASVPNLKFTLIGENSDKYLPLIKELNLKDYVILDQVQNTEVASYLKDSDVFVLFSNYENLPCVILESFACGVPVVSTNVGGIAEHFPNNFGYLINPKDDFSLEKSIFNIYNSKLNFDKAEMREYAVKNFSIDSICKKISNLYQEVLEN